MVTPPPFSHNIISTSISFPQMTDPFTNQRLAGKVAIVTGGASGIGEATARLFASHGALAVIIADIQDDKGYDVAASISPDCCTYVHCDVSDEEQVKSLLDSTVKTHGRLDIMFSNAGTANPDQSLLNLDLAAMDRLFGVNVRGMAACVKHAARVMVEGGVRGSIVCTASYYASAGESITTDYVMSKHAVLGLVRCASRQLGEYGIRVNCVSPGAVATPLISSTMGVSSEEATQTFGSRSSMKGIATVKHIADAVLFLSSAESGFVTGHDLAIDGGFRGL